MIFSFRFTFGKAKDRLMQSKGRIKIKDGSWKNLNKMINYGKSEQSSKAKCLHTHGPWTCIKNIFFCRKFCIAFLFFFSKETKRLRVIIDEMLNIVVYNFIVTCSSDIDSQKRSSSKTSQQVYCCTRTPTLNNIRSIKQLTLCILYISSVLKVKLNQKLKNDRNDK